MYLTQTGYRIVTDPRSLDIFQQYDSEIRERAETEAIEEIAGYLRARYNTDLIFSQTAEQRNPKLVALTIDIVLYNLATWLPGKMALDIRLERYERAMEYLTKVAKGQITLNLPPAETNNNTATPGIKYGGIKPSEYDW